MNVLFYWSDLTISASSGDMYYLIFATDLKDVFRAGRKQPIGHFSSSILIFILKMNNTKT